MNTKPQNKATAKKFDHWIIRAIQGSALLAIVGIGAGFALSWQPIWIANLLLLSATCCYLLFLLKNVVTGKKYAEGAKKRRKRLLPFLYAKAQDNSLGGT